MKNLKTVFILLLTAMLALGVYGCSSSKFEVKPRTGVAAIFDESKGYYNEFPTVIQEDESTRYIYYTRNTKKNDDTTDSIAVRKGTLKDGVWNYGKSNGYKTILSLGEEGSWDSSYIYAPSVVKGKFTYNGEQYSYLMAYSGSCADKRFDQPYKAINSQIGFAVSNNPLSDWVKVGNAPYLTYNQEEYSVNGAELAIGCSEPSLVSYDGESKVYLFYSFYTIKTQVRSSRYVELDLAGDLKDIGSKKGERGTLVNPDGIADNGTNSTLIAGDWAYDTEKDTFVVVRDWYTLATNVPYIATGLSVVKAAKDSALYWKDSGADYVWSNVERNISSSDLIDFTSEDTAYHLGYSRIYSACLVTDAYGRIDSESQMELILSACPSQTEEENWHFCSALYSYKVN